MCTIGVLFQVHPAAPLVLAHNRDEFRGRSSTGVMAWTPEGSSPPVVGGGDEVSGGSWLLIGPRIVAAVTNHHRERASPPGARSRGELVSRTSTAGSLDEAEAWLRSLDGEQFGGFHLLVTDGARMLWATNAPGPIEVAEVAPGAHALRNTTLNHVDDPITSFVREAMQQVDGVDWERAHRHLQQTLAVSAPDGPCVDLGVYGTRSAGVLWWGGERSHYVATDRSPDVGAWRDFSHLLG